MLGFACDAVWGRGHGWICKAECSKREAMQTAPWSGHTRISGEGCSCSSCSKCLTTPLTSMQSRSLRAHTARRLAQFVATAFHGM